MGMWRRALAVAVLLATAPAAALASDTLVPAALDATAQAASAKPDLTAPEPRPGEVLKASDFYVAAGGRAWISSGFTNWNFRGAGIDPLSELKWRGTDAILPEVNVEVVWKRLVFMASAGKTGIGDGVLIDDDFLLSERQGRFSHTRSSVTDEGVTFVNADIGFRLVSWLYSERSAPGYFDVLVGYQYWREKYVAFGATGILDFFGVFDNVVDSHIKVITQDYNWQSVRLGFRYHIPGPAGIGVKARVFIIPWTHSELKDVHHLRSDLKQNPSFASRAEGGFGTQLEGGLTYTPWPWLTFEAGYQYWGINPGEGVKYTYSMSAGTFRDKLNEQKIERYGPYVGVQGRF